jgi:SP family sugar porter-like MFS transporter
MQQYNKKYVYFISLVSAMGGLLFGYDWVVIGGAKPFYEIYFGIQANPLMQAWMMSIALLGCLIGATLTGVLANKYGRKRLLVLSAFVFIVSSIFTGMSSHVGSFLAARLMGGIAIGLAAELSPMYIAEIAPTDIRGRLVSFNQLTIVIGILSAQIINMLIADKVPTDATSVQLLASWNVQEGWRWMFWAVCLPSSIFFLLSFIIPESPRWFAYKNKMDQVKRVLLKVGNADYVENELRSYSISSSAKKSDEVSLRTMLKPGMRKLLLIGIVIAMFQQWSGTNIIFNYAQEVFQAAGYGLSDVLLNIVITGIAFLLFTFIAVITVDKIGRRKLMLIGSFGLFGIYAVISVCYYLKVSGIFMIIFILLAIGFYAMSLGPITWVLLSEIFPNRMRGVAMAVCTSALWIASFLLTYTFPFFNNALGVGGTFGLYSTICLLGFIFIKKNIPETKNKTLEELEGLLTK